jgi:hypothetical protein
MRERKGKRNNMIVKNTSNKVIGLGALTLLPDDTAALPEAFGENHPTVKYYIQSGFLTEAVAMRQASPAANEPVGLASEQKIKALGKMKLAELESTATGLGIEVGKGETKDTLKEKIIAAYMKTDGADGEGDGNKEPAKTGDEE